MIYLDLVFIGCWIILLLYWLKSAKFLKSAKEIKREYSKSWFYAGGIFFISLLLTSFNLPHIPFLSFSFIPKLMIIQIISVIFVIIGFLIAIISRKTLASNWSSNIDLKKDHELITNGIYGYVRHPIYSGFLSMALGTLIYTGTISSSIFFIVMLIFIIFKIKEEEELLTKNFGKDYEDYKKRVKSIVPYIL
jgi:protein-S-isoprenylcysteine O-methyltransferase Ste14